MFGCCCGQLISDYKILSVLYTQGRNPMYGTLCYPPSGYHPWAYIDMGTGNTRVVDIFDYGTSADDIHVDTWRRWKNLRVTDTSPSGYTKVWEREMRDILYGLGDGFASGTITYTPDKDTYDADPKPGPGEHTYTRTDAGSTITMTDENDDGTLSQTTEYYFYNRTTDAEVFDLLISDIADDYDWSLGPDPISSSYGGKNYLRPQRGTYVQNAVGTGDPVNWIVGSGVWSQPNPWTLKSSVPDPAYSLTNGYAVRTISRCPLGTLYAIYRARVNPGAACVQRGTISDLGCLTGSSVETQSGEIIDATNPSLGAETNPLTWDGSNWITPTDPSFQNDGRAAIPWNGPVNSDRSGCTGLDVFFRLGAQFDVSSITPTCDSPAP